MSSTRATRTAASVVACVLATGVVVTAAPAQAATPSVKTYTRAQVAKHRTPGNCWTIIGRGVYNMTAYINRHPGGSARITALCGKDGTSAFQGQHGGGGRPTTVLRQFKIGRLA